MGLSDLRVEKGTGVGRLTDLLTTPAPAVSLRKAAADGELVRNGHPHLVTVGSPQHVGPMGAWLLTHPELAQSLNSRFDVFHDNDVVLEASVDTLDGENLGETGVLATDAPVADPDDRRGWTLLRFDSPLNGRVVDSVA